MTKKDNDTSINALIEQCRQFCPSGVRPSPEEAMALIAEIERLRERCLAYKGQVEAGSIAIQHLQGEIDRLLAALIEIENRGERLLRYLRTRS